MDKLGFLQNGTLSEKIADELDNTHNLNNLLNSFTYRLSLVSNETFSNDIQKYIKQMYDIDKNGQRFRYHEDKNKNLSFSDYEKIDVNNISKIMEEVYSCLRGVDSYLDHYIEMSNDIIQEWDSAYEDDMKEYYY